MDLPAYLSDGRGAVTVRVRVQPGARGDELAGERDGALVVRVSAPPVDGRANAALCSLLARAAGVPKTSASVIRGASGREKLVRLKGVSGRELARRLDS